VLLDDLFGFKFHDMLSVAYLATATSDHLSIARGSLYASLNHPISAFFWADLRSGKGSREENAFKGSCEDA
jgi:hypothetical protein